MTEVERRVYLRPLACMTKNEDGTWHVEFDWGDSCDGEFDDDTLKETWNDFSEEACDALDAWAKTEPLFVDGVDIPGHVIEEEPV